MRDVWLGANLDIATPKSLKPGKYLLRHEMINLEAGPAQFFPNCIQLDVAGDGSSVPDPTELVSFPGAYDKVRFRKFGADLDFEPLILEFDRTKNTVLLHCEARSGSTANMDMTL